MTTSASSTLFSTRFLLGLVVLVVICFGLIFYQKGFVIDNDLTSPKTTIANTVKVGIISPLTGEFSALGTDFVRAAKMAVEERNKNSEIKFELIVEDDVFSQTKGLSAVKKLLEFDQVSALINLSTPTINSAYDLLVKKDIPVMQLGLFKDSDKADNVFMLQPDFEPVLREYAKFVKEKTKGEKTEIFYFEDASVLHYVDVFAKEFGADLVKTSLSGQFSDYQSLVTKSIASKVKHVVAGLTPEHGSELIKKFSMMNYQPSYYALWDLEVGADIYRTKLSDSEVLDEIYFPTTTEPIDPQFLEAFFAKHQAHIQAWAEQGYDCFKVLGDTYSNDKQRWISNISAYQGKGVTGYLAFNESGNRIAKAQIRQFKDLKNKILE